MRLYLTGFMGAGKTTVGRRLAESFDCPFVDLDAVVESRAGLTVGEIFERLGEPGFRRLEGGALRRTGELQEVVVATGGGTPVAAAHRRWMRAHGAVVWLDVPFALVAERLAGASGRPLWRGATETRRLFEERRRFYAECDLAIDCAAGLSPDEVASAVSRALEEAGLR